MMMREFQLAKCVTAIRDKCFGTPFMSVYVFVLSQLGEPGANSNGERWIVSDISHHYEVESWGQLVRGSI